MIGWGYTFKSLTDGSMYDCNEVGTGPQLEKHTGRRSNVAESKCVLTEAVAVPDGEKGLSLRR